VALLSPFRRRSSVDYGVAGCASPRKALLTKAKKSSRYLSTLKFWSGKRLSNWAVKETRSSRLTSAEKEDEW